MKQINKPAAKGTSKQRRFMTQRRHGKDGADSSHNKCMMCRFGKFFLTPRRRHHFRPSITPSLLRGLTNHGARKSLPVKPDADCGRRVIWRRPEKVAVALYFCHLPVIVAILTHPLSIAIPQLPVILEATGYRTTHHSPQPRSRIDWLLLREHGFHPDCRRGR